MARNDALLRLHRRLLSRRDDLRKKVYGEETVRHSDGAVSDPGDLASEDTESELNSQLSALESRELARVEAALRAMKEGRYGICEGCEKKIPVNRLNALPYSTLCIGCQRQQEQNGSDGSKEDSDWESAIKFEATNADSELTLGDLQMEL